MIESLYLVFYTWLAVAFVSVVIMLYSIKEIDDSND